MTAPGFFEEKLWKNHEGFYYNLDTIGKIAIKLVLKYAIISAKNIRWDYKKQEEGKAC